MRKLKTKLGIGKKYRLSQDVGVIPKGIYRLEELGDFGASFSVGEERLIHFTLIDANKKNIRKLLQIVSENTDATETDDFAERYFSRVIMTKNDPELLESRRCEPFSLVVFDDSIESRFRNQSQLAFSSPVNSSSSANTLLQ